MQNKESLDEISRRIIGAAIVILGQDCWNPLTNHAWSLN
jgi:hypothetical protein